MILVVWPCIESGKSFRLKECLVLVWCLIVLTINGLLCDFRDIAGDRAVGTATIPVRLGRRNTVSLLVVLAAALVGLSGYFAKESFVSPLMPAALAWGSTGLFFGIVRQAHPVTISIFADLLLALPAIAEIFSGD